MPPFEKGDRVRIDIPDEGDPDFEWHGQHGMVAKVIEDDAGEITGDPSDSRIYRINLDEYDHTLDLRQRNVRAPFDS